MNAEIDVDAETERLATLAQEYLQAMPVEVLVAVANEIIDLNAVAHAELRARGLDDIGRWIGFDKA
ncbi:hypothetical protein HAP94_11880 [Acidithiobacillus ferrivorans]|nr:hypothetical protein [Acidithiobacillus ferrivorans]